jgi:hypothetical protein
MRQSATTSRQHAANHPTATKQQGQSHLSRHRQKHLPLPRCSFDRASAPSTIAPAPTCALSRPSPAPCSYCCASRRYAPRPHVSPSRRPACPISCLAQPSGSCSTARHCGRTRPAPAAHCCGRPRPTPALIESPTSTPFVHALCWAHLRAVIDGPACCSISRFSSPGSRAGWVSPRRPPLAPISNTFCPQRPKQQRHVRGRGSIACK